MKETEPATPAPPNPDKSYIEIARSGGNQPFKVRPLGHDEFLKDYAAIVPVILVSLQGSEPGQVKYLRVAQGTNQPYIEADVDEDGRFKDFRVKPRYKGRVVLMRDAYVEDDDLETWGYHQLFVREWAVFKRRGAKWDPKRLPSLVQRAKDNRVKNVDKKGFFKVPKKRKGGTDGGDPPGDTATA